MCFASFTVMNSHFLFIPAWDFIIVTNSIVAPSYFICFLNKSPLGCEILWDSRAVMDLNSNSHAWLRALPWKAETFSSLIQILAANSGMPKITVQMVATLFTPEANNLYICTHTNVVVFLIWTFVHLLRGSLPISSKSVYFVGKFFHLTWICILCAVPRDFTGQVTKLVFWLILSTHLFLLYVHRSSLKFLVLRYNNLLQFTLLQSPLPPTLMSSGQSNVNY